VGNVFGANDALLPGCLHLLAAKAGEECRGELLAECQDDS
jgi:hypothetical protein